MLTTHSENIEPQEAHDILRNGRRRKVIEQLQHRMEPMPLRELSELIAEHETKESPPPRNIRDSVYNSLHQTHLPKLDEMGVVKYDQDRKTIQLRERAREVDLYMEVVTSFGITWGQYYRALATLALLFVIGAEIGTPGLADVGTLPIATGTLVVLAVSTAHQLWSRRWFYLGQLFR